MAAWLFFTQPTVKSFELGQFAKQCITKMSIGSRIKHLDKVLLAAMEFDILQVSQKIVKISWFNRKIVSVGIVNTRINGKIK